MCDLSPPSVILDLCCLGVPESWETSSERRSKAAVRDACFLSDPWPSSRQFGLALPWRFVCYLSSSYFPLQPPASSRLILPLGPGCKPAAAFPPPLGGCPVHISFRPRQDTIRGQSRRRRADLRHGNHGIPARTCFGGLSSPCCVLGSRSGAARHSCRGADLMLPRSHRACHVLASKMTLCSRARGRDWRLGPPTAPLREIQDLSSVCD